MKVLSLQSRKLFWVVIATFYSLKVIGLAPFSVETATTYPAFAGTRRIRVFRHSKSGLIYNFILALAIFAVVGFVVPNLVTEVNVIGSSTTSTLLTLIRKGYEIFCILASCLSIMTWAFKQREAASVLNRLLEIDVRLSGWNNPPSEKTTFVFMIVDLIINAYIWVSFWVLQFMVIDFRKVIITFVLYLPGCITYFFTDEYSIVVGLIARDIEIVNITLTDLRRNGNRLLNSQLSIINSASHRRSQLTSLKALKSIRMTLSELCEDVEDFFSLPILFCIGNAFLPINALLYRFIIHVDSPKTRVIGLASLAVYTFTTILLCLYSLTSLAFNVTRIVHGAKRTKRIINKLMANDELMTQEIKAELELFSLCLGDKFLDFTAHGLFTLDSSLLLSVLGTEATYLFILIQFWSAGVDKN